MIEMDLPFVKIPFEKITKNTIHEFPENCRAKPKLLAKQIAAKVLFTSSMCMDYLFPTRLMKHRGVSIV